MPPSRADRLALAPAIAAHAQGKPKFRFSSAFTDTGYPRRGLQACSRAAMKDDFEFDPHFNSTLLQAGYRARRPAARQPGDVQPRARPDISKQVPAWSLLTSAYLFRDSDHLKKPSRATSARR